MKIAIIGTGISGLGAAYLLHKQHDITVYEADQRLGGHSRTITVKDGSKSIPVDTGFIVFNKKNYPLLTRLFDEIEVPIIKSDMSFGVTINQGWLEYGSKGMFAQKANYFRPQYWGMIADILAFNKRALAFAPGRDDLTLRDCLKEMGMGDWFCRYYIQAMGAAIWSCSAETILDFPADSFLRFFDNHGLLSVNNHPQWHTVKGGSREYIARMTKSFEDRLHTTCGAAKVKRHNGKVIVRDTSGADTIFDHVVIACHADDALRILEQPSPAEQEVLSVFRYQDNAIIVHSDTGFMPTNKKCWASWVYFSEQQVDQRNCISLSYWMNQLQDLQTQKPILITLNPHRRPPADMIHDEYVFRHPVFTLETLRAQKDIDKIQNQNGISYCGAYHGYGFHEDGFQSAVAVAKNLGVIF